VAPPAAAGRQNLWQMCQWWAGPIKGYIDRSEDSDGGADVSIAVKSFVSVGVGNRARCGKELGRVSISHEGPGAVSPSCC